MGSALCGALAHITRNLNKKYELFEYDDEKVGRTNAARRRFEQLQLQPQDLQRLFNVFNNFCDEDEEFISYDQFCEVVGPEVASEANRMKLFDIVAAGKELLQFDDLVLSLWKYCACGRQTIFELAFRLCDADDSGVLEALEVQAMFQRLYGAKWKNLRHFKPELFKALTNNNPDRPSADIDVKAFTSIARGNLMLIAEALAAQRGLRRFGGLQYWKRQETLVATTGKGRAASAYDAFKSPPAFKRRTAPPAHDTHTPVEEFKPNHDRFVHGACVRWCSVCSCVGACGYGAACMHARFKRNGHDAASQTGLCTSRDNEIPIAKSCEPTLTHMYTHMYVP